MIEHTPTPWVAVSRVEFNNGLTYTSIQPVTPDAVTMRPLGMANGEHHVCRMTHTAAQHAIDLHRANAAFIVKAVNNHDTLLCVVRQLIEAVDSGNLQMSSPEIGEPENNIPIYQWHEELLHYARAALASIKERP